MRSPAVAGPRGAVVAGSLFGLVGLRLCLMFKRVLHTRTHTFTDSAFEGEDHSYRTFTLPWSDGSEITIHAQKKRSFLRRSWVSLFVRQAFRNPATASLILRIRSESDPGKALFSLGARHGRVTIPFWRQPELIDALAYGCRTYASDRFRGVQLS